MRMVATVWKVLQKALRRCSTSKGTGSGHPLEVYSKGGGLGDELMALCAVQAVQRQDPSRAWIFYTRFFSLLQGAPGVADMRPLEKSTALGRAVGIGYQHRHEQPILPQIVTELGCSSPCDFTLQLAPRDFEAPAEWPQEAQELVLIQTTASGWTPNKQWPEEHWQGLIDSLPSTVTVVEVGTSSVLTSPPRHPRWHTLVGQTSMEEYAGCFQRASVFVGPVSSGMHLAHAFSLPSVIIVGGYEAANFPYPLARQLGSEVPCAPCWLRTPCPHDWACLRRITVDQVKTAVLAQLQFSLGVGPVFAPAE